MKRLIAIVVAVAVGFTMFCPAAYGSRWDPMKPPLLPHIVTNVVGDVGDDSPWIDPQTKSLGTHQYWWLDFFTTHIIYWIVKTSEPGTTTIDHSEPPVTTTNQDQNAGAPSTGSN